ncbi:MAG: glycosyltransferase family 39 protein [Cyanobacteria bacterium P01_C01_bin.72]
MQNKSFFDSDNGAKLASKLALFGVFWGLLARVLQYLSNRSLWVDEINLAANIIKRSYGELSQPLSSEQAAPLGFLWLEKLATQLGGNSEYALRLLPFLASIISLIVFYLLVRRYCSTWAAPLAIALFACGRYTLYYATELKPYSSDVAVALILFWVLLPLRHRLLSPRRLFQLACIGSFAIWLSYPSVLVLAALEGWNLCTVSWKSWRKIIVNRGTVYLAWLINFGLFYLINISDALADEDLSSNWEERYPSSFGDILWLFDALGRFFYHPMGFVGVTDGIGIFAFIVGCVSLYRRQRRLFLALIAPFVVNLIAAYLHQYPFRDRLILFLAPLGMIIVAEGIVFMLAQLASLKPSQPLRIVWLVLGCLCLVSLTTPAIYRSANFMLQPQLKHEVRPVLEYVVQEKKPGDKIYVYTEGIPAFDYYLQLKGYQNLDYVYGKVRYAYNDDPLAEKHKKLAQDLQSLQGRRVWFILRAKGTEKDEILQGIDRVGQRQDSFIQTGASAHLYQLD